jgi:amino acid permease
MAGVWESCCLAAFSYLGCEALGAVSHVSERPRETLPKAVRGLTLRSVIYSVGAAFVMGLNVSSRDPVLRWSLISSEVHYGGPFALLASRAGIPGLSQFIKGFEIFSFILTASVSLFIAVYIPVLSDLRVKHCMPWQGRDLLRHSL